MGNILCFIPEQCADFEVVFALHLLNGYQDRKIVTVGYSRESVTAQSGIKYTADLTLEEAAELNDIEALIMPGGPIRERNERLVSFLQTLHQRGVLLAAICFAPQYLARCGLLDTRRYTTSCTIEHIRKLGVSDPFPRGQYVDERVVTDGNIITAKGHAFVDFAFEILKYLGIYTAHQDELDGLYMDIVNRNGLCL